MSNEAKTHWKKLTNPDYIGAYTILDGSGQNKELTVKIKEVKREMVTGADGKKEECTVCYLVGQKPLILNKTNQKTMEKLFNSPYIEDWSNKSMILYVAKVRAFGETVDALRVKSTLPELPELTPTHEKWAGAIKALKEKSVTIEQVKASYKISDANLKLLTDAIQN